MLFSPLEQFQVIPLLPFHIGKLDFSITNYTLITFLFCSIFITYLYILLNRKYKSLFLIPNHKQTINEMVYKVMISIVSDNVGPKGEKYFPFIFTLFVFVLLSNLIGLVPYSFTLTSHLIVTFALAMI